MYNGIGNFDASLTGLTGFTGLRLGRSGVGRPATSLGVIVGKSRLSSQEGWRLCCADHGVESIGQERWCVPDMF